MSDPPPPAQEPHTVVYGAARPPRKSRWKLWLALGGGAVLFIALGCVGLFGWFFLGGKAEVDPVVDDFIATIEAADYAGAYQKTGTEWQQLQTPETFAQTIKLIQDTMGPLQSKSFAGFNIERKPDGSMAVSRYHGQFANAQGEIAVSLSNAGGNWRVVGYRVDSPLFLTVLACKHCGAIAEKLAAFCPQCGKPMTAQED